MVLLPLRMKGDCRIQRVGQKNAANTEEATENCSEAHQDSAVTVADRKQVKTIHRVSTVGRLQPYFLIL